MDPKDKEPNLTEEEQEAEERDRKMMEAVRAVSGPDSTPLDQALPGVTEVDELAYWAAVGNTAKVKMAIAGGCDVNSADESGYTALHAAAENGHLEVVRILIENGADISARWSGKSALNLAESEGEKQVAELLRQAGGNAQ